jgi:hypothetical protein
MPITLLFPDSHPSNDDFELPMLEQSRVASAALESLREEVQQHVEALGDVAWQLLETQIARSSKAAARQIAAACDRSELARVHDALAVALNEANAVPSRKPISTRALTELLAGIRVLAIIGAELHKQSSRSSGVRMTTSDLEVVP